MQVLQWVTFTALWMLVFGQAEDSVNPDVQNYEYHYFVRDEDTQDFKSHEEKKIGNVVRGQYTVAEPEGDLRIVKYTADDGGFRANVKFEEGGSPFSEKQSRETNAKTGYEFQWLPANPDDIEAAGKDESEENSKPEKESAESLSSEESSEKNLSQSTRTETSSEQETSSIPQDITSEGPDNFDSGASQDTAEQSSESEGNENASDKSISDEMQADAGFPAAKLPDESSSEENGKEEISSQMPSLDLGGLAIDSKEDAQSSSESEEKENSEEGKQSSEAEEVLPDSIQAGRETEPDKESESDETKESEPETGSDSGEQKQPEGESVSKSEESKEESAEAAASSPETAATEPSQMYLPILPFQNPFLNFPMQMGSPQIESNSPTIIYASQNFYNPWQWLGSRRAVRDESSVEDGSNAADNSQYLSSLGYLIMPPRPQ